MEYLVVGRSGWPSCGCLAVTMGVSRRPRRGCTSPIRARTFLVRLGGVATGSAGAVGVSTGRAGRDCGWP